MAKIFLFILLLGADYVFSIDEDYEIPYTDNYGYVYDPETRQFVKQGLSSPETRDSSTLVGTMQSNGGHSLNENQVASEEATPTFFLVGSLIGLLVVAAVVLLRITKTTTIS